MKKHNAYAENQDSAQRLMKICQQDTRASLRMLLLTHFGTIYASCE